MAGADPRRRVSLRTRLTFAVGVVAACFLGAAAWLFGTRASDVVLDGAKNDQFVVASVAQPVVPPNSGEAAMVYRRLQTNGLIGPFYEIVGASAPSAGQAVEVFDGSERILVAGEAGAVGRLVLSAPLVVDAGGALLGGVEPGNIIVTSYDPPAPTDAAVGAGAPPGSATTGGVDRSDSGSVKTNSVRTDCASPVCPEPGEGVIAIAGDAMTLQLDNVSRSVEDISRSLWIAAGVLTLLAIAATWLLAGRVLRPVGAITERVEAIGAAGTGERVPVPSTGDEIGHLAHTMNGMLDRLDLAAGAQRRFVADASHELRSPLAVIRTETEVALAHPEHADWAAVGRSVLDETNRLEGLVTDLLTLAQHDHRDLDDHPELDPTAVTDVEEIVMSEAARGRRVPVDTGRVLAGRVAAHPSEIARVVRHLLDNAARHAETRVTVAVTEAHGSVLIVVDDDGAGVPEEARGRIFDRFARLEDSRSRDAGGAGLGLAVVASIVSARGGTAVVGDASIGGARFTITLPAAAVIERDDGDERDAAAATV